VADRTAPISQKANYHVALWVITFKKQRANFGRTLGPLRVDAVEKVLVDIGESWFRRLNLSATGQIMMGRQAVDQSQLFYLFNLEEHIPTDHLLRRINPIVTRVLADLREKLAPFYSDICLPSCRRPEPRPRFPRSKPRRGSSRRRRSLYPGLLLAASVALAALCASASRAVSYATAETSPVGDNATAKNG
jgi:hypothetical protein